MVRPNPKTLTLNPQPQSLNPKPSTSFGRFFPVSRYVPPKPQTPNPQLVWGDSHLFPAMVRVKHFRLQIFLISESASIFDRYAWRSVYVYG